MEEKQSYGKEAAVMLKNAGNVYLKFKAIMYSLKQQFYILNFIYLSIPFLK